MSRELNRSKKTFGHGNAGLGSNFMDLAHRKLKPGGVLALVLPFTFNNGRSWMHARKGLAEHYKSIGIVSIAATGSEGQAFSADTGMAECLIVATKRESDNEGDGRKAMFSNVTGRPKSLLEAQVLAKAIRSGEHVFAMQRVPPGNTVVGSESDWPSTIQGSLFDARLAGVLDGDVAHTVHKLQAGKLHFPRKPEAITIRLVPLREVADRGLYHMDINGRAPRGAFDIRKPLRGEIPTYPVLWNHRAEAERTLFVTPDRCGAVRAGCDEKAAAAWERASRLHFSVDFRLNSQSLAMCLTTEPSLGGTAWPNILTHCPDYEEPLLLWSNSTLGLMQYWWIGTRQQQGRARVKITALPGLRVLDPRQLSGDQRAACGRIFSEFESRTFLPANEAYRDSTRKDLDQAILIDLLGMPKKILEPLDLLRLKWCAEPSVHGGKNTRPTP